MNVLEPGTRIRPSDKYHQTFPNMSHRPMVTAGTVLSRSRVDPACYQIVWDERRNPIRLHESFFVFASDVGPPPKHALDRLDTLVAKGVSLPKSESN